jgi:hypothetical protein
MTCRPAAAGMPQHGNDEIEMVGVQAGHETAHTCSADLSRPAGSPPTGIGRSMSITSGTSLGPGRHRKRRAVQAI